MLSKKVPSTLCSLLYRCLISSWHLLFRMFQKIWLLWRMKISFSLIRSLRSVLDMQRASLATWLPFFIHWMNRCARYCSSWRRLRPSLSSPSMVWKDWRASISIMATCSPHFILRMTTSSPTIMVCLRILDLMVPVEKEINKDPSIQSFLSLAYKLFTTMMVCSVDKEEISLGESYCTSFSVYESKEK